MASFLFFISVLTAKAGAMRPGVKGGKINTYLP